MSMSIWLLILNFSVKKIKTISTEFYSLFIFCSVYLLFGINYRNKIRICMCLVHVISPVIHWLWFVVVCHTSHFFFYTIWFLMGIYFNGLHTITSYFFIIFDRHRYWWIISPREYHHLSSQLFGTDIIYNNPSEIVWL